MVKSDLDINKFDTNLHPKNTKIESFDFITFSDSENKLYLMKCSGKIETGKIYYIFIPKSNSPRIPKHWQNRFIVLSSFLIYPSNQGDMGLFWKPSLTGENYEYSCLYGFYVLDIVDKEEQAIKKRWLNTFKYLINDNYYYNAIPLINELIHWHNGIINYTKLEMDYQLNSDVNNWDDFKINQNTLVDSTLYKRHKELIDRHCVELCQYFNIKVGGQNDKD